MTAKASRQLPAVRPPAHQRVATVIVEQRSDLPVDFLAVQSMEEAPLGVRRLLERKKEVADGLPAVGVGGAREGGPLPNVEPR